MSKVIVIEKDGNRQLQYDAYYGNGGGMSYLREALPISSNNHLYHYIKNELEKQNSKYKPEDFGIEHPLTMEFRDKSRSELVDEIIRLRGLFESKEFYNL